MGFDDGVIQVSEDDNILGGVDRRAAHSEKRILHREVDIFLINNYGILLDLRVNPPKWCHFGGHPNYDDKSKTAEDYRAAAIREFCEETGYKFSDDELEEVVKYQRKTEIQGRINHRWAKVFLSRKDIPESEFKPQEGEVQQIKYFRRAELEELMKHSSQIMAGTVYLLTEKVPQLMEMVPA